MPPTPCILRDEFEAISLWLRTSHRSPLTGAELPNTELRRSHALRNVNARVAICVGGCDRMASFPSTQAIALQVPVLER